MLTTSSFELRFDRFLLPGTVVRQSGCLQPIGGSPANPGECQNPVFVEPTYDPVLRGVILRQEPGARLQPSTTYRLTLYAATTDGVCGAGEFTACGVRAFDEAPLAARVEIDFTTAASDPPEATDELPPSDDFFCRGSTCRGACTTAPPPETVACNAACNGDAACLTDCANACAAACPADVADTLTTATCAYSPCHKPNEAGTVGPAMGVDLSTPARILETVIGQTSHLSQTGENASVGEQAPVRFGRSMPIVDPGFPGNSFLLYKVLLNPGIDPAARASQEEIDRLRGAAIMGMPMPLGPEVAVDLPHLLALRDWIAAGAPVAKCP